MPITLNQESPDFGGSFNTFDEAKRLAAPNPQQLDTAASRIQSRISAQNRGNQRQLGHTFARRGQSGSGGFQRGQIDNAINANAATATGLAELEQGFWDKQQQGAQILNQTGAGQAGAARSLGELALGEDALIEENRANRQNELNDFFTNFIQGGNLHSSGAGRGAAFDQDFQRIMQLLLEGLV